MYQWPWLILTEEHGGEMMPQDGVLRAEQSGQEPTGITSQAAASFIEHDCPRLARVVCIKGEQSCFKPLLHTSEAD